MRPRSGECRRTEARLQPRRSGRGAARSAPLPALLAGYGNSGTALKLRQIRGIVPPTVQNRVLTHTLKSALIQGRSESRFSAACQGAVPGFSPKEWARTLGHPDRRLIEKPHVAGKEQLNRTRPGQQVRFSRRLGFRCRGRRFSCLCFLFVRNLTLRCRWRSKRAAGHGAAA